MIRREDVSIIIPHLGTAPEQEYALDQCIASLRESEPEIKIVVAKNGAACPHMRDVRVVSQGQCKAVNAAVAITDTPWILITNDDMIFPPGWFDKLVKYLNPMYITHADLGMTDEQLQMNPGAKVLVDDVNAVKKLKDILCLSPKLVEPRKGAPTFIEYFCGGAGGDFNKEKFFEFVKNHDKKGLTTGFNLPFLIRRDLWNMIGGYDIQYDPWGSNSDSDLQYKIMLAGVQPMQCQEALVYHFSQTSGTFEPKNSDYWGKNFAYFEQKWGFKRTDDRIWESDFRIPTPGEGRIYKPFWEDFYV